MFNNLFLIVFSHLFQWFNGVLLRVVLEVLNQAGTFFLVTFGHPLL